MEIDSIGNVLWHNEIHAPSEGLFRNLNITQYGEKYIVSGIDQNGNDSEVYIDVLNSFGELVEHFEPPNTPLGGGGGIYHLVNNSNEIIAYQSAAYEWINPPSIAYNMIRIFKQDVDNSLFELQNQYFTEQELSGSIIKMIQVSSGYALAGTYRQLDNNNTRKAWIMKIDDDFQQEWYTELSYDDELGCCRSTIFGGNNNHLFHENTLHNYSFPFITDIEFWAMLNCVYSDILFRYQFSSII
jgi:hypothetical protein